MLDSAGLRPEVVDARLDLHTDMVRRWKTELPEPLKRFYFISTICDPRQKALRFPGVSASERGVALEWFEAEYDSLWAPAPTPITAPAPATAIAPVSSHPQHQGASFMAFMAGLVHLQSDQAVPTADLSQSEAHKYLELSPMPMDTDILAWWATNEKIFPNLSVMARQYLGCPATSASAERLFSIAGRVYGDLGQAMDDAMLEERMWARINREHRM